MSDRSENLALRFEEVMLNGTWVANTNYQKMIADVSFEESTHQVSDLNSIYVLVFHMHYYIRGVLDVFEGGELTIRDKYSFQIPETPSKESWTKLQAAFMTDAKEFAVAIRSMNEDQITEGFVKREYGTVERNINGMIEHAYYHLGQISLIKKLIRNGL